MDKLQAELAAECGRVDEAIGAEEDRLTSIRIGFAHEQGRRSAANEEIGKLRLAITECDAECAAMRQNMDSVAAEDAEATELEQLLDEKKVLLAAALGRVDDLEKTVAVEENRLRGKAQEQLRWLDAVMREFDALHQQCAAAEAGERYIDARCGQSSAAPSSSSSSPLATLEPFLDELTSEREASYRDLAQDLMVRIDEAEELDRAVGQIQDANTARREQTIAAAHDFANQLTAAFEGERERFVAAYRTSATRNAELRHHLHRGTHNARPTQLTERERKALQKQHDTAEELHGVRQQLEAVRAEIHELDRRAETTLRNSKASDEAFEKARARHREELKEGRTFIRMLEREAAQWTCAKSDLELLLKYTHAGSIPDSVAQPKWKLAVAVRRTSRMTSAAASVRSGATSTVADDDDDDDDDDDARGNADGEIKREEGARAQDEGAAAPVPVDSVTALHRTASSSRAATPEAVPKPPSTGTSPALQQQHDEGEAEPTPAARGGEQAGECKSNAPDDVDDKRAANADVSDEAAASDAGEAVQD